MRVSTETACSRFIGKTFFYFVPEAVKGENNTLNKRKSTKQIKTFSPLKILAMKKLLKNKRQ